MNYRREATVIHGHTGYAGSIKTLHATMALPKAYHQELFYFWNLEVSVIVFVALPNQPHYIPMTRHKTVVAEMQPNNILLGHFAGTIFVDL